MTETNCSYFVEIKRGEFEPWEHDVCYEDWKLANERSKRLVFDFQAHVRVRIRKIETKTQETITPIR